VGFFGNLEKLAKPLLLAMLAEGLTCYSVWEKQILESWPTVKELMIDAGFEPRMSRVVERESARLCEIEPDAGRRAKFLNAFVKSNEFRAEMAKEARLEKPIENRQKKTFSNVVNCLARWRAGHPAAAELVAVRKLSPPHAVLGLSE
jgi:hypothetical protein